MGETKETAPSKSGTSTELTDTQRMMYAFGDSRRPNLETARIVESVVLSQVTGIVEQAARCAMSRGSKMLALEDLLFIMRHSPVKVQRLIKYLSASEVVQQTKAATDGDVDTNSGRTSKRCKDFFQKMDEGGRLVAACKEELYDEIYLERLVRNERTTRSMSDAKYEDYCRARSVGFRGKHSLAFQAALDEVLAATELGVERVARRVLSYLAYETLGQIVELCLLVRRDTASDPVTRLAAPLVVDPSYPIVQVPIENEKEGGCDVVAGQASITSAELREVLRRLQQGTRGRRGAHRMPLIAIQ